MFFKLYLLGRDFYTKHICSAETQKHSGNKKSLRFGVRTKINCKAIKCMYKDRNYNFNFGNEYEIIKKNTGLSFFKKIENFANLLLIAAELTSFIKLT